MPQLIAMAVYYALFYAGVTVGTAIAIASIAGYVIFAVALYEAASLLTPKPKLDNSVAQQPIRQATAPRRRYYGRVKASGIYAFLRAKHDWLYSLLMIASQEIDAVEEHWLGDKNVTSNVDAHSTPPGAIVSGPLSPGSARIIYIDYRRGRDTETYYSQLAGWTSYKGHEEAFPDLWDSSHRLDGIFSALLLENAPAKDFSKYYPSGPYAYISVFRAAKVWDPRILAQDPHDKSTWTWTQNGALIVLDYLRHPDGMRLPFSFFENVIDDWANQADICDEDVEVINTSSDGSSGSGGSGGGSGSGGNSGSGASSGGVGTEKRYRLSGGYEFSTEPKDVLALMLEPMGAILTTKSDGSVVLRVAGCEMNEPDVIFDDTNILAYVMRRSLDKADLRNEIRAIFTDPDNGFQDQETEPWVNQASVDINGLQSMTLDLHWSPSASQCRRRQKMEAYRLDPDWSGEIVTNAYGLDSIGERYVRVRISDLGIDEIFERMSFEVNIAAGTCKIKIRSFPRAALEWSPADEQGESPAITSMGPNDNAPAAPEDFTLSYDAPAGVIRLTAMASNTTRTDLHFDVDWSTDSGETWTPFVAVDPSGGYFATYEPAYAGTTYFVRARFVSIGGLPSDYVTGSITPASDILGAPTATLELVDL